MTAAIVIIALVAATTLLGLAWQHGQGRVRRTGRSGVVRASELPGVHRLASGATLLQFSSEVCAACTPTRALLGTIASTRDDVAHVDLDITHRPDLANRFNVLQTPTTLILDRRGTVRARIGGAPRRDTLTAELTRILEAS